MNRNPAVSHQNNTPPFTLPSPLSHATNDQHQTIVCAALASASSAPSLPSPSLIPQRRPTMSSGLSIFSAILACPLYSHCLKYAS